MIEFGNFIVFAASDTKWNQVQNLELECQIEEMSVFLTCFLNYSADGRLLSFVLVCGLSLINELKRPTHCWVQEDDFYQTIYVYVSLQLLVQNRMRKWHFPLNFTNGINWTGAFLLNLYNGKNWTGAFFKAFGSSEALISVLCKNAYLYDNISNPFQSETLYIVLTFKWSCLDTNLWICNLCICQKTCQQNANFW